MFKAMLLVLMLGVGAVNAMDHALEQGIWERQLLSNAKFLLLEEFSAVLHIELSWANVDL